MAKVKVLLKTERYKLTGLFHKGARDKFWFRREDPDDWSGIWGMKWNAGWGPLHLICWERRIRSRFERLRDLDWHIRKYMGLADD